MTLLGSSRACVGILTRHTDLVLVLMVIAVIALMIVPLPTPLVDLLISINLAASFLIMMMTMYTPSVLGFSSFPTLLLFTTLFRLGLNIATTRLILLQADAGEIIYTFGEFAVGGNFIVGAVVFIIIAIIQFLVIAKGSERVSEVGARFSLDAMPGKQMSIDADLRAGSIDGAEAQRRRDEVALESKMYGAMDGAMKFVKGDAIAGLIIAAVNIIAGTIIGSTTMGLSASESLTLYGILTIGDGLVSQIPSLLISISAGILVTRSGGGSSNVGEQIGSQVFAQPKAILVAGALVFIFALVPGFPKIQLFSLAFLLLGVGYILRQMVSGVSDGGNRVVTQNEATVTKLRGTGLASVGKESSSNTNTQNISENVATVGPGIIADTRLNAVIINDFAYRMPYYAKVIADLDQPVKLVELHAAIVDVDINATKNLGINWSGARQSGNWSIGGGAGNSGNLWDGSTMPLPNNSGGIFSTVFNTRHSSFMATINALEENSQARTLGRPSVLTLDNIEATLEDTTTRYVSISGYQDVDLFKVESGTVLQVTPHIIDDPQGGAPFISMIVNIQSNQDSNDNVDTTSGVPPIKQTKINTRALVREGQSLLLGGYYIEYKQSGEEGVPGLKDVPVAGKLFGSEGDDSFRRERLIIITPRVMDLGELQELPADLDNQEFVMSPTQDNYLKRAAKTPDSSGCSSNRASR